MNNLELPNAIVAKEMTPIEALKLQVTNGATSSFTAPVNETEDDALAWFADLVAKGANGILTVYDWITPARAKILLTFNPGNRLLRKSIIKRYAQDIQSNKWELNGEPIIIAKNGQLNNGQHRCYAVLMANKGIYTAIGLGYERDTRKTLDQGIARTTGDVLGMGAVKNCNMCATIAKYLVQWDGQLTVQLHRGGGSITRAMIVDKYQQCKHEIDYAAAFAVSKKSILIPMSTTAFLLIIFERVSSRSQATDFMKRVFTETGANKYDPLSMALRRITHEKLEVTEKAELIIRAWNATRTGKQLTKLTVMGNLPAPV
jgi:hypothetical protein